MKSKCFVPGCNTGYKSDRDKCKDEVKKVNSLFKPPENYLEIWDKAIPRADQKLRISDRVCELHFSKDDIQWFDIIPMKDGSVVEYKRSRPKLRTGAIPLIFPNLPSYLSKTSKKRELPAVRLSLQPCLKKQKINSFESDDPASSHSMLPYGLFDFDTLVSTKGDAVMPTTRWGITSHDDFVICAKWDDEYVAERKVVINRELGLKVFLKGRQVNTNFDCPCSIDDVSSILKVVNDYVLCSSISNLNVTNCLLYIQVKGSMQHSSLLCKNCRLSNKAALRRKSMAIGPNKWHSRLQAVNKRNYRLRQKVAILKRSIINSRKGCASAKEEALNDAISNLPKVQQESVRSCFSAAKAPRKGTRYTIQWIYECLLIKIKSQKTYEHLRSHNILALPCTTTLGKYIRKIQGVYGFQRSLFNCLRRKSADMNPADRRGSLLFDEMKISSAVSFECQTLQVQGFVDLGKYTPHHQRSQKGDHALVFMFQPFRGKWVQSIACFLSKGAASGTILHHLVVECIVLLENSGFFIDVVTSYGASWNRNMWNHFGISIENVSCTHICDSNRRLWFISDFPHLIKNCRNAITEKKVMKTPNGVVKLKHWEAVVQMDDPKTFNLKVCPKLKPSHLKPKSFQKMNVGMAFQFFSGSVAAAMELFKNNHPELNNCEASICLIRHFYALIGSMNARTPKTALKPNSPQQQTIKDFLQFFEEWEEYAVKDSCFISKGTAYGIKVTLKATLESLDFLTGKCGYKYLMTSRLNQDALERFFGLMRSSCGSRDHPDPALFLQVFRLNETYSLVKPPKGSNVSGGEMLTSLMNAGDTSGTPTVKANWKEQLDIILDKGTDVHVLPNICDKFTSHDHTYCSPNFSDVVIAYVAGYVARRARRFTKCETCLRCLVDQEGQVSANMLIRLKTKGFLLNPSRELFNLISTLDRSILKVLDNEPIHIDTFAHVAAELENDAALTLVGCLEHKLEFSHHIVNFYLVARMHFVCQRENERTTCKAEKNRELRKMAKLL